MTQDIKQVHWGAGIQFFKKDFLKRWKLDEYNNPNEPSLFVGLYDDNDRKIFTNHKSYKLGCIFYNLTVQISFNLLLKLNYIFL